MIEYAQSPRTGNFATLENSYLKGKTVEYFLMFVIFVIFLVLWIPLLVGIAWKRGYLSHLFFTVETDNIGFVDSGESNVFVYANTPGHVLRWVKEIDGIEVNDYVLIEEEHPNQAEEERNFIQRTWGLYWVGPEFLNRTVHMIPLTKKKRASSLRPGMPVNEWIVGSDEVVTVNQLRRKFPRPVPVVDVKFNDGVEANMLTLGNYEVVVPRKIVYGLKGDFFGLVEMYTMTAMKDVVGKMDSTTFKTEGQVEGSQMSKDVVSIINKVLIRECGVRIKGVSIPVYNLSTDREEAAAKEQKLQEQEGLGRIKKAEADAEVARVTAERAAANKIIDATAEAKADRLRNAASITDFTLAAKAGVKLGANPDIAVQASASVARSTRYTHPDSKVTTQVEGGATVAIPPAERKVVITDK